MENIILLAVRKPGYNHEVLKSTLRISININTLGKGREGTHRGVTIFAPMSAFNLGKGLPPTSC